MNRQKKEARQRASTRQLMGIKELTDYGANTSDGTFLLFLIRPDNLSVMPEEAVRSRVLALANLLRASSELCLTALDSRESFQHNKDWYQQQAEKEPLPALRSLLQGDSAHLDAIQTGTASSREFVLLVRGDGNAPPDPNEIALLEKRIHGCGFAVRPAQRQDVKRILAVYYQQDAFADDYKDYDGEGMVKKVETPEEKEAD